MSSHHEKLPVAALERIDDICIVFENAWRRGESPSIEATLAQAQSGDKHATESPAERAALLAELITLDIDYRVRQNEQPDAEEYRERFPDDLKLIQNAFDATADQTRPTRFEPPSLKQMAKLFPAMEVLELIGVGGMGAVYKARQKGLDRLVAIKILPGEIGKDVKFALRFTREARALARLNHPNIVSVHEFGSTEGTYYFLMEYVDGSNLQDVIRGGKLEPAQALAIVPHLCDALQYAHDHGVVHRDIKPANILLNKNGDVIIADFGLSRLLDNDDKEQRLTGTHQVMGTFQYMAPEQMEGAHHVDHRADIYSLGVIFYEMLTGELPLGRFAPPSQKSQIDVRLDEVVLRSLEKEPIRRYQHASEIKSDIESIAASTGNTRSPAGATPNAPGENESTFSHVRRQEMAARLLVLRRELMSRIENSLRPLFWGQIIQMLIGIGFIAWGVSFWAPNRHIPHRLAAGISLHVYGVLLVISAALVCTKIKRFDYSKPIDAVRTQLDRVRSTYIRTGSSVGLIWWVLWIPAFIALGIDAIALPVVFWGSLGIGVAGIFATIAIYRWICKSSESSANVWSQRLAGESLNNAYIALDEMIETEIS